jgi:hypothetical protein
MIDFPASPTDGQIFVAPTGVSYRWVAASTLWVAASGTTPGGDFFAGFSATYTPSTTPAPIVWNTVKSGNSGGWLNIANGRYTPPAGRFFLSSFATFGAQSATITTPALDIRKNGVGGFAFSSVTINGNQFSADVSVSATVDANGTDYFEIYGSQSVVAANVGPGQAGFTAFPISGVQGPAGVISNGFRVLQRTVISTPQPTFDITNIPADINDIEVSFDLIPATNAVDLYALFYGANGVLDNTTAHYTSSVVAVAHVAANASAPAAIGGATVGISSAICLSYPNTGSRVYNGAGGGSRGSFKIPNIKGVSRRALMGKCSYVREDNTVIYQVDYSGDRGITEAITGLRLIFSSGNIAVGAVTVWGSP